MMSPQKIVTTRIYKIVPENPQACLWDEWHPLKAGVFRGRQSPNNRLQSNPIGINITQGGFDYDNKIKCSL